MTALRFLLVSLLLVAACSPAPPACIVDIVDADCNSDGGPEAGPDAGPIDGGPFHTADGGMCSPPTGACDFLPCCSTLCCLVHHDSGVSAYQCAIGDACP
jgi:hypothetical protein